jgi:hypothetical protein
VEAELTLIGGEEGRGGDTMEHLSLMAAGVRLGCPRCRHFREDTGARGVRPAIAGDCPGRASWEPGTERAKRALGGAAAGDGSPWSVATTLGQDGHTAEVSSPVWAVTLLGRNAPAVN